MSRIALVLALAAVFGCAKLHEDAARSGPALQRTLEQAADEERVPRELVLAIAWTESRWSMRDAKPSADGGYGLMHLVDRLGASDRENTLRHAAALVGLAPETLKTDAFANALGGAALLREDADRVFAEYKDLREDRLGDWYEVVMLWPRLPTARLAETYALEVFRALRGGVTAPGEDGAPLTLAPQVFSLEGRTIWGSLDQGLGGDYCPGGNCVNFVSADAGNYTQGRGGNPVTTIVIHDMEGTYSGSIGWFTNPAAQASAHYLVRSSDGDLTQMVRDGDTAWHAGNWDVNQHAIGIEHEGYAHDGARWYTEAMYQSSAALVRWLTDTYGIPKDRSHIIGHYEVPDPSHAGWFGGSGHHHDPCDSWAGDPTWHNVTACFWDWTHYMDLVNGTAGGGTPSTGDLKGFVGDACCGTGTGRAPIANAVVTVNGGQTTTNASGFYDLTLAPGTYAPQASAAGYQPADHSSISGLSANIAVAAGATSWGSILLHKDTSGGGTGTLEGFVADACCGLAVGGRHPIAGATVTLVGNGATATTDASGVYKFAGLAAGGYTPQASKAGFKAADPSSTGHMLPLSVVSGAATWGSILLSAESSTPAPVVTISDPANGVTSATTPVSVIGTVSDTSVANVDVNGATVACASGNFTASVALSLGVNTIKVKATNAGGTGTTTVTVTYAPPETGVSGTVTSMADQSAISGAVVTLSSGPGAYAMTDAQGHYKIPVAAGSWSETVQAAGYQAFTGPSAVTTAGYSTLDVQLAPATPNGGADGGTLGSPGVTIDAPIDGQSFKVDTITVSGKADVPNLAGLALNDQPINYGTEGDFNVTVRLHSGSNTIVVKALDANAVEYDATVTVTYAAPKAKAKACGCSDAGALGATPFALMLLALVRRRRGAWQGR